MTSSPEPQRRLVDDAAKRVAERGFTAGAMLGFGGGVEHAVFVHVGGSPSDDPVLRMKGVGISTCDATVVLVPQERLTSELRALLPPSTSVLSPAPSSPPSSSRWSRRGRGTGRTSTTTKESHQ